MTDNAKIVTFCTAILLVVLTLVGFQIRAVMGCEAEGGIPVRAFYFPSFTACVN